MRREKKWVFYCDHCKKSSRSGGHMRTHEMHCTRNPKRECRMCKIVGNDQASIAQMHIVISTAEEMAEPSDAINPLDINVTPLRDITHNCPACILTAIRQYEDGKRHFNGFDFKKEAKEWLEDYRVSFVPIGIFGNEHRFDAGEWATFRAKRTFSDIGLNPKLHSEKCACEVCALPF